MKKRNILIGAIFALILIAIPAGIGVFAATGSKPDDTALDEQLSLTYIDAQSAWNITTGSHDVQVGVIDSGVSNHEDFEDNLLPGWDFFNDNAVTNDDLASHGTGVAGIIGAKGNNGKGVSGICWDVSIIPLQTSSNTAPDYLEDADATIKAYVKQRFDVKSRDLQYISLYYFLH